MTASTRPAAGGNVPFLDLYGAWFQQDPHAALRACRDQSFYADTALGPAILGYEEVQAVTTSRQFRTPGADFLAMQGISSGPLLTMMQGFLLNTDGAPHDRVRRLVSKTFTGSRVESFRPTLRALAQELAAGLGGKSSDFVAAFADPFALRALCTFVGIPVAEAEQVARWTSDISLVFGMSVAQHVTRIQSALAQLNLYVDELLRARRAAPGDDLLSALIAAEETGDLLSDAELRSLLVTFLAAGHHTTESQLGNAMVAFMAHPEQWQLLRQSPLLVATAAEEVVRYCPASVLGVPRIAKAEFVLRELVVAAGSCVLPITGAANRDPQVFAAADRFDITARRRVHLTFGGGIHYCLGAALARAELQEALLALSQRLQRPQPTGPATWLPPTEAVYGPVSLPLHDAAA